MRRPLPTTLLLASLLTGAAHADVGATLSVQSDAIERGVSYTGNRPGLQLGVAWDGASGWYAGASLARFRLDTDRRGGWLRAYGGRVFALLPGLDAEAGLVLHRYEGLSRYDHAEAYVGFLGEGWSARLHHAPDYYGSGQRTLYGEANLRWPARAPLAALGHVGVLRSHGASRWLNQPYNPNGPTRIDLRAGASWQLGESLELQLAWVSASRGGPVLFAGGTRRRTALLSLSAAL